MLVFIRATLRHFLTVPVSVDISAFLPAGAPRHLLEIVFAEYSFAPEVLLSQSKNA